MMHRNLPVWIGAAVVVAVVAVCMPVADAQPAGAATDKVIAGEIQIPEISGVAFLPGDQLLVVADDPFEGHLVFLLKNASQRLLTGKVLATDFESVDLTGRLQGADGKARELDDLEEVIWNGESSVFLITSHSRNRRGRGPDKEPGRFAIIRLDLVEGGGIKPGPVPVFDLKAPSELQEATNRTPAQGGFNLEGAAWSKERSLWLGLRSPTRTAAEKREKTESNEDAVVLEVGDLGSNPFQAKNKTFLSLNGSGIRGMLYDSEEKGHWIVAGLSPDLKDDMIKARWDLWFRKDDGTLKLFALPGEAGALTNAESVARVSLKTGAPHLLLVEDGPKVSHYVLLPVPRP